MNAMEKTSIREHLVGILDSISGRSAAFDAQIEGCPDLNEYASRLCDQHISLSLQGRDQRLYEEAQLALARVDSFDFGYCEECGEPIGLARMKAMPTATLCVHCQERTEAD